MDRRADAGGVRQGANLADLGGRGRRWGPIVDPTAGGSRWRWFRPSHTFRGNFRTWPCRAAGWVWWVPRPPLHPPAGTGVADGWDRTVATAARHTTGSPAGGPRGERGGRVTHEKTRTKASDLCQAVVNSGQKREVLPASQPPAKGAGSQGVCLKPTAGGSAPRWSPKIRTSARLQRRAGARSQSPPSHARAARRAPAPRPSCPTSSGGATTPNGVGGMAGSARRRRAAPPPAGCWSPTTARPPRRPPAPWM